VHFLIIRDKKRVQILQNYLWLCTKQKKNMDEAMASFIEMLEEDQNYLPAILGMATGFMVEKSQVSLVEDGICCNELRRIQFLLNIA
jgi:hypothetical protein